MRRAQSVRHQTRTSLADRSTFSSISDDLGVLREQPEESTEDALRRQLLAKERENDKLQAQLLALQDQLSQRPPLEHIQVIEREYKNLEILLTGTQRENERCMTEMERGKNREKTLERELARLAGDNWQSTLNITPSTTTTLRSAFAATTLRSPRAGDTSIGTEHGPNIQDQSTTQPPTKSTPTTPNAEATRAHIEQVRLLILGMEQRLQTREEKLASTLGRAESESARFAALRQEVDAK